MLKGIVSSNLTVTAIFKEDQDGNYTAQCPEIPGCIVTGSSKRDVTKKIKAAVEGCLAQLLIDTRKRLRAQSRTAGKH